MDPAAGACAMAVRLATPFEPWMKDALIAAYSRRQRVMR